MVYITFVLHFASPHLLHFHSKILDGPEFVNDQIGKLPQRRHSTPQGLSELCIYSCAVRIEISNALWGHNSVQLVNTHRTWSAACTRQLFSLQFGRVFRHRFSTRCFAQQALILDGCALEEKQYAWQQGLESYSLFHHLQYFVLVTLHGLYFIGNLFLIY